jgi:hypothetical protein
MSMAPHMKLRFAFRVFSRHIAALATVGLVGTAGTFIAKSFADDERFDHFRFAADSLVLSRTVYTGTAATVTVGETLPLGCPAGPHSSFNVDVPTTTPGTTTAVTVTCGAASDNGEYPNLRDSHNVWNNASSDPSFGMTSPIFLDDITSDGRLIDSLQIPSDKIVTSFSSKSELALNRSIDGKSITFVGYHGGPGCGGFPVSPTSVNLLDVSNADTPAVCDPTNPIVTSFRSASVVPTAYYRAVAEVDSDGKLSVTDGNAYSGDNGRAAIKAGNGLYYTVGNDNSGNLSKKQLPITPIGIDLINATGAELLAPLAAPAVPPNVTMVGRLEIGTDKPGKDTNFRGLTIFNNTLYITKGSGSNGINTVYEVGTAGVLPTGSASDLATVPITILPGFPNTTASTFTAFPFGIWFANATTLYVCDEGDGTLVTPAVNGNVADAQSLATAGLQKWSLVNGTWTMLYVLQDGLNIGVPYSVVNYPTALNPATGGCRNITGRHSFDGTVTIYAVTSTISANGDQGADPNKLVKVRDPVSATTLPVADGDRDRDDRLGHFVTIRSARAGGSVLRGYPGASERSRW